MKIWTTTKLESVLERCLPQPAPVAAAPVRSVAPVANPTTTTNPTQRPLTRLLQSERVHGTTERDPTQKRHDFQYFSRSSYFVLVEDIRQELATIAVLEYPITKKSDGTIKATWPILHCHPQARGPFIAFDEREKRRWEKTKLAENKQDREQEAQQKRAMQQEERKRRNAQLYAKKNGDLRRSVSMNNLHRRATYLDAGFPEMVDLDADYQDSANASGYLASTGTGGAYIAASGNSVGITSTTGTTSTTDNALRNLQLPAALRDRIQQQVVTSRKYPSAAAAEKAQAKQSAGTMGPPERIPERVNVLRKSRSTNTLRLPKREEGKKPGYCESCRVKFENFQAVSHERLLAAQSSDSSKPQHVEGRKHRKFAADDANFLQLDFLLAQVRRRTIKEVEEETQNREARRTAQCSMDYLEPGDAERSSDETYFPPFSQQHIVGSQAWEHDFDGELDS
jgi:regulatory subunit for Cdc7p protein kinase